MSRAARDRSITEKPSFRSENHKIHKLTILTVYFKQITEAAKALNRTQPSWALQQRERENHANLRCKMILDGLIRFLDPNTPTVPAPKRSGRSRLLASTAWQPGSAEIRIRRSERPIVRLPQAPIAGGTKRLHSL